MSGLSLLSLDGRRLEIVLRNISGLIVLAGLIYGMAHSFTRLVEQYIILSSERQHDWEVLRMCSEDRLASESTRMRSMCLQARAETSTPVFLAAILKTCRLLTSDVIDSVPNIYSPYTLMCGCTLIPWLLPLFRMLHTAAPTRIVLDEQRNQHHVTFIVPTEWAGKMGGTGGIWGGIGGGWGKSSKPLLIDCEDPHPKND
jgi:hypothetical protein